MTRTRIISLVVIVLSVVAIVWSLGGGLSRERGFDFAIEGALEAAEIPDTTGWGVTDLEIDTTDGRYRIAGRAVRPCVVELGSEEVVYCSTLFIERGEIIVEQGRASGTVANDARTAMRAEVDSLAWNYPEGEYSADYKRAYDSLARAYVEANRANLYGGWLAEQLSRELPIEPARELYEQLTKGVRRAEAVAPLRERVERDERSQVGRRAPTLPAEVEQQLSEGRYVLLSFWASWNYDDREHARLLAELSARFGASGLSVCRISMDNSREQWQSSIEGEPTVWIQLFGVDCGLAIESLPMSYVISPDRKIAVRATSMAELAEGVAELF